jgi:hypothetical protein
MLITTVTWEQPDPSQVANDNAPTTQALAHEDWEDALHFRRAVAELLVRFLVEETEQH